MKVTFNPYQPIRNKQQVGFGTNIQIDVEKVKPDLSGYDLYAIEQVKKSASSDHLDYTIKVKSPRDGLVIGQILDSDGKTIKLKEFKDGLVPSGLKDYNKDYNMDNFGLNNIGARVKNIYENALPALRKHRDDLEDAKSLANRIAHLKK